MNPSATPQFVRQTDEPLYPKILYNRPVTRTGAGRLLVVGGHSGEFSLPTTMHQLALAAGAGECQVVMPDTLAKILGGAPGTAFAAANPSGSLGTEALARILALSEDADAVALGASLSNNSTTAILIEKLVAQTPRPLIVFADALAAMQHNITAVTDRPDTLIILTMAEVFKLCGQLQIPIHIRKDGGLLNKLEIIQNLASASHASYAVYGTEIIVASGPELVVTPINYRLSMISALFYAVLSTFWLQTPATHHAGLVTAAYVIRTASAHLGTTNRPAVGNLAAALNRVLRQDNF